MANMFLNRYRKWGQEIDPEQIIIRKALRVNTLKCDEASLVKSLTSKGVKLEKVPFLNHGYYYESTFGLSSTPEYLQGKIYLQDAASQIPVEVLNPLEGETVLDMAASPGGKSTQISAMMKNTGTVIALDIQHDRIQSLKNNTERLGIKNTVIYNKDSRYADDLNLKFDKVLLDAPCSGNFCIDPNWLEKRTLEDINEKAFIQRQLIKSGVRVLKKEGTLVYSTCSLEVEENENIIDWAKNELDIEIIDMNLDIGSPGLTDTTSITRRLWPNKTKTQGFFVAKMIKH